MLAAERDHQPGELEQRQPGVVARAPVAGDRDDPARREAERRARVAPLGRIGIELVGRGAEALLIGVGVIGDGAVGDEQRPGLQQVAARMRADAVAARGPGRAVTRDFLGYDGA